MYIELNCELLYDSEGVACIKKKDKTFDSFGVGFD
jgi:hypothetical protein